MSNNKSVQIKDGSLNKKNVHDSFPVLELREKFHQCWTDNVKGEYSKKNWQALRDLLQTELKLEI
jgi:hypothetical protein